MGVSAGAGWRRVWRSTRLPPTLPHRQPLLQRKQQQQHIPCGEHPLRV